MRRWRMDKSQLYTDLYRDGKTVAEIAAIHGVTPQAVRGCLKRAGVFDGKRQDGGAKAKAVFDDFVTRANAKHGRFTYTDTGERPFREVLVTCPEHGQSRQLVRSHLLGKGCPECPSAGPPSGFDVFQAKARAKHGETFEYNRSTFGNALTPLEVKCRACGHVSHPTPSAHLSGGTGCWPCRAVKDRAAQFDARLATEKVGITRVGEYRGALEKVRLRCETHGEWTTTPNWYFSSRSGTGCPKCTYARWGQERRLEPIQKTRKSDFAFDVGTIKALQAQGLGLQRIARAVPDLTPALAAYYMKFRSSVCDVHGAGWSKDGLCLKCQTQARARHASGVVRQMWADREPALLAKMAAARARMPVVSVLSRTVEEMLQKLGVEFEMEKTVGPYSFDVFLPSVSTLLELNGEYFHALPRAMRNDKSKATFIERFHPELKLHTIWEVEFYKEGRVMHLLNRILGQRPEPAPVDWKALSVRPVDKEDAARFISVHHYLGRSRAGTHYGLYEDEALIGVCSFSPFQRNEQTVRYGKGSVELSRFCLDPDRQVKNLGSWFLSRCLKAVAKPVVTYADSTQGHDGALYKACNFTVSHTVPPDYTYADASGWGMHKRSVWRRASLMRMKEAEYAEKHGLQKKWGGEKLCFTYGFPTA